jgi:hypothetical protein
MMISRKAIGLIPACLLLAGPAYSQDAADVPAPPAEAAAPATPSTVDVPATPAPSEPAAPQLPAAEPAASDQTAAPSASPLVAGAIGQPPEGKGQIVFYRPSMMGMAIPCSVKENDALVSRLGYGRYFVTTVDPGKHSYMVKSEARDVFPIEVEEGETYYVKCSIAMGIMVGRPNLSPSDQASFEKVAAKLKLEPPTAPQATAAADKPAT